MENLPITTSLPKPASGAGKSTSSSAEASAPDAEGSDGFDAVLQRQLSGEPDAAPAQASSDKVSGSEAAQENVTSEAPAYPTTSDSLVATMLAAPAIKALEPVDDRAASALAPGIETSTATSGLAGSLPLIKDSPLPEAKAHAADQAEIFAAGGKALPKSPPLHEGTGLTEAGSRATDHAEYLATSEAAPRPAAADIAALARGADGLLPLHAHALASVASRQAQGAGPASAQELKLAPAVGAPGWDSALAQKVIWQVGQQQQVAELHLNPPQLGPLQVQVSMAADQGGNVATAHFVSQHAAVREAIEAAMPRLREMLAESGIALGNTTVGNGAFQQQNFAQAESHPSFRRAGSESGTSADGVMRPMRAVRNGMVDTFA